MGEKSIRTRRLDRNDGAARRVALEQGPDPKLQNESCSQVSPSQVRDAFGPHAASQMLRDVNVQDAPPIMADDEEAVEYAEGNRWHSKEIHGCNGFPMVSKRGQPALGPVGISRRSFHPTGDGSLGEVKAEHEEFPWIRGAPQVGFSATIR